MRAKKPTPKSGRQHRVVGEVARPWRPDPGFRPALSGLPVKSTSCRSGSWTSRASLHARTNGRSVPGSTSFSPPLHSGNSMSIFSLCPGGGVSACAASPFPWREELLPGRIDPATVTGASSQNSGGRAAGDPLRSAAQEPGTCAPRVAAGASAWCWEQASCSTKPSCGGADACVLSQSARTRSPGGRVRVTDDRTAAASWIPCANSQARLAGLQIELRHVAQE